MSSDAPSVLDLVMNNLKSGVTDLRVTASFGRGDNEVISFVFRKGNLCLWEN